MDVTEARPYNLAGYVRAAIPAIHRRKGLWEPCAAEFFGILQSYTQATDSQRIANCGFAQVNDDTIALNLRQLAKATGLTKGRLRAIFTYLGYYRVSQSSQVFQEFKELCPIYGSDGKQWSFRQKRPAEAETPSSPREFLNPFDTFDENGLIDWHLWHSQDI